MTRNELLQVCYPSVTFLTSALLMYVAAANESMLCAICGAAMFFVGLLQTTTLLSTGGVDWS
jgi:hypothetical protein